MLALLLSEYSKHEMDVNIKDINGHSPLFVSAIKGYKGIFYDLLRKGGGDM